MSLNDPSTTSAVHCGKGFAAVFALTPIGPIREADIPRFALISMARRRNAAKTRIKKNLIRRPDHAVLTEWIRFILW
jgi:hypothetical protein